MVCFGSAFYLSRKKLEETGIEELPNSSTKTPQGSSVGNPAPDSIAHGSGTTAASELSPMEQAIDQEVFGMEMGYGLLVLADKTKGGD